MRFAPTPAQDTFRQEVVSYIEQLFEPRWLLLQEESEEYREAGLVIDQELVRRGWWTLHWPKEYGGQGSDHILQAILSEEEGWWHVPTAGGHGRFIIGPAIMEFGTEEQKRKYLPPIARAESILALGYTEPDAGSDLAAMTTSANREGDDFIVNGHKTFITFGHFANGILLAAITDPQGKRYKNTTLFIVDMDSPGIRISPMWCRDGNRVNDVYFENVRVPASQIVGELNNGFYHMAQALNHERSGLRRPAGYRRLLREFVELCRTTNRGGRPLSEDPFVRQKLAEAEADLEAWRLICWRVVWLQYKGEQPSWEASMSQLFRKEITPRFARTLWEITNLFALVEPGSPWTVMQGRVERLGREMFNIHGQGGKNVTRNVIARRGLSMPRGS